MHTILTYFPRYHQLIYVVNSNAWLNNVAGLNVAPLGLDEIGIMRINTLSWYISVRSCSGLFSELVMCTFETLNARGLKLLKSNPDKVNDKNNSAVSGQTTPTRLNKRRHTVAQQNDQLLLVSYFHNLTIVRFLLIWRYSIDKTGKLMQRRWNL